MSGIDRHNDEKSRIQQRYRGIAPEKLEIIPAIHEASFYEDHSEKRVAVYVRVSTDDPRQTSSFELQRNHYEDVVQRHAGWHLVNIYADEGISGTSLKHRDAFMKMIQDCENGKIDLIVVKSVSRFARNVYDCIGYVRKLAALPRPIGVFFESEQLYTLNKDSEMSLSFIATLAQEESHAKSNSMNLSYEMRFRRGIFLTPELLGYDVNEEGNLVINEEEALTVRLVFFMYLYGYTCQQIAETLMRLGRLTKRGNCTWSASTVLGILQNERHCGDVLSRKTWTPNYLDHKTKKNVGNRNQYRARDHHHPIISRDDYIATQKLIANAKYGYKGVLPTLRVIDEGALRGFVIVNMRWGGFTREDYFEAAYSVIPENNADEQAFKEQKEAPELMPGDGEFDLRGYELVRNQFMGTFQEAFMMISKDEVHFSTSCFRKFERTIYVELLLNPIEKLLVVRPTAKDNRNAVQWTKINGDRYVPRDIHGAGFLSILYDILGWNRSNRYRAHGVKQQNESGSILMFDLKDTEYIIPIAGAESTTEVDKVTLLADGMEPLTAHSKKSVIAFPASWIESFGCGYYEGKKTSEIADVAADEACDVQHPGRPFSRDGELQPTSGDELSSHIAILMDAMKEGPIDA